MASFNAIAEVTDTLRRVIDAGLARPPAIAGLCQINDLTTPVPMPPPQPLLTLTLYEVLEDPMGRNRPNERRWDPVQQRWLLRRPPTALLLRYLVTPWSGTPLSDHQLLGRAVQTLYEDSIISGPLLQGSLFQADEAIQVTMVPLSIEDRTHVWRSVNTSYRLSVNYEVRVVHIETTREVAAEPVRRRSLAFTGPGGPP